MRANRGKLSVQYIDGVLTRFAAERLQHTSQSFRSRFVAFLYLTYAGESRETFLKTASCLTRINITVARTVRSPFRRIEAVLLTAALAAVITGLFLLAHRSHEAGIILVTGGLIHGLSTARKVGCGVRDKKLRLLVYRELHQIIDNELRECSRRDFQQ